MSSLFAYLEEAAASLWRNKGRSFLTMLGMIIGSASIIAVFGVSRATTSGVSATFTSFGQSPVVVFVDNAQDYPQNAQIHSRDLPQIAAALGPSAREVLPAWNDTFKVSANGKTDNITVQQDGDYHSDGLVMAEGHEFTSGEVQGSQRVAVVSQDVATKFFGDAPAMGQFLRINGARYKIVGVFGNLNGSFFNSIASSTVILPYTTYRDEMALNEPPQFVAAYPTDPLNGDAVGKAMIAALQHIHGDRAQYKTQNGAEQLQAFESVLNIISVALSAIGGVALVVAGIGIMNIMLVSVTERTREIGIRKAIGANRGDIIKQFLFEAILLSLGGGLIGMVLGIGTTIGAASLLSKQLGTMLIPYVLIVSIAMLFSLLVGTVFGSYPAVRAASMDPIEALRS